MLVEGRDNAYWFAHALLLFHLNITGMTLQEEEYAFVQYFNVTEPIDVVDSVFKCLSMMWETKYEMGHNLNFKPTSSSFVYIRE